MTIINNNTKFIIYAAGIFVCYFYFGVLQEKITRGEYKDGEKNEKFTYMFALVFFQCLVNYAFSKLLLMTIMKEKDDNTKTIYYASSAMTYLLAMVCSTMALKFVSYPTQVVGKAGKPIPVMLLGVLLGKKSYPMRKYVFVFLIVLGVILFMFKDGKTSEKQTEQFGLGEVLLLLIVLSGAVILFTGEFMEFIGFIQRHPISLWHIMTFSMAGAFGQFFIFSTVAQFGPLPCSIITTTRKFFTVLGSVLLFGNNLFMRQWIGTVIVFVGLFLDAAYGKTKSIKKETIK
ncbi:hypothetical protein HCN44_001008 [Aphidius gifuensis]|uniref:Uncharacterized protein n=1 Tax=Aphidius gifuensis TaxID=684658 RepID=A0A834XNG5_APHGI|nr:hypothetical protein HCN44_001008 [Aphidius gifuensis]